MTTVGKNEPTRDRREEEMKKIKYFNTYELTSYSKLEQLRNKYDLVKAEIEFKIAKKSLTATIEEYKSKKFYINISVLPEYTNFLGKKELLKRTNKKRTYIKNFIKNMNKTVEK